MPSIRMLWRILRQALQHRILPPNAQKRVIGKDGTRMLLQLHCWGLSHKKVQNTGCST